MPTGYTAEVADGKVADFRTFALICARQFGACVTQRDDPMSEPPKHREPPDCNARSLEQGRARLAELNAMTLEDAAREREAKYQAALASDAEYAARKDETRRRYEAMLAKVEAWKAPTADHVQMRQFMLDQLTESIRFDSTTYNSASSIERDPATWLENQKEWTRTSIDRDAVEVEKENRRCAESNAWIDALYASLPVERETGKVER